MSTIKRKNKNSIVEDLTQAQKFIFAPFAFQALAALLDLGIIEFLDKQPASETEIINTLHLDEYTVKTLLQIAFLNNIVENDNDIYCLTKIGRLFLYDDMTKANFNFVKDVCYLGISNLTESFKERSPIGLRKFVDGHPTIYSALTVLPEQMKKSWYEFDHFYSDNSFEEVFSVITQKYSRIYDIGGNTGKFEILCLSHDSNFDITMFDLKCNIDKIKTNPALDKCKFYPINVLDKEPNYPSFKNGAILMSQFLDCFSKNDIIKILKDLSKKMDDKSAIYILEPYTDMQKFEGAKYSLTHASLYFTSMANGVSKFYTLKEMKEIIKIAGLNISKQFDDIGSFNYTLLECKKNAMVSD
ncbi:SAM-dependent methyltransferase [bacterium]|nr:SAM-dependent methyltransferase [bacterium]